LHFDADIVHRGGWLSHGDHTLRLLLLLGLFPSVLRRLMMSNHAAGAGADDAMMAGKVTSDTPDSRAL
jgi:hypothetical protein